MKKLLLAIFILIGYVSFGQYPVPQSIGGDSTLVTAKGGLKGRLIVWPYADTTAANLERIRQYPGAMIFTTSNSIIWIRNNATTAWVQLGGGTTPTGSFWRLTGNYVPITPDGFGIGTNDPFNNLPFKTNGITRMVLPLNGLLPMSAGTDSLIVINVAGELGKVAKTSGAAYTFPNSVVAPGNAIQLENDTTALPIDYFYGFNSAGRRGFYLPKNIYNSNGTLTGNRTLNGNLYNIAFDSVSNYLVNAKRLNLQTDATLLGRVLLRNNTMRIDTGEVITRNGDTLSIPTYDGSYQAMHPDVYYNPNGWNGYKYWMAFTPYTNGNDDTENPSIVVSNDNVTWIVPPGVTNPLVPWPGGGGYNADTDILEGQDDSLHIFYINNETDVFVISSANGVAWTSPIKVIDMSAQTILSPSVILDSGIYKMYYIDAFDSPNTLKYRTASTPTGTWSSPITCAIGPIPSGKDVWHMNMTKTGDEYHAAITTSNSGSHLGNNIHFAASNDGINFRMTSSPILSPSATAGWDDARIYRGALIYVDKGDESYYNLYYSAANAGGEWHTGLTKLKLSQYVRNISTHPKIINFASNDGVSRGILDSMNKLTVRRAAGLTPTGFYPQVEVKTDLVNEKIAMGMFETGVGSNPYIVGDYSTALSSVHNTGILGRLDGAYTLGMVVSNASNFGGTAGTIASGFFGVFDLTTGQWLMAVNKSRELFLGNSAAASRVRFSTIKSSYVLDSFGVNTLSPARVFHTVGTVRHATLGTASSDTTTYKPLGIDSNGDVIPITYWPGAGGGGGGGTVTSFAATDGNGFDFTVTNPTTTPTLTATTTVADGRAMYSNSGAITGDDSYLWNAADNRLTIGTTTNQVGTMSISRDNTDFTNTAGAGSVLYLKNPNASGQTVVYSEINGSAAAKWRTDFVGNISWVSYANTGTTGHYFYVGGDFGAGSPKMLISSDGVRVGSNVTSAPVAALDVDGIFYSRGTSTFDTYNSHKEIATPAAATSGYARIYAKTDGLFYGIDDAGAETKLSNTSAATTVPISGLTAGTVPNTINSGNNDQNWQWNSLAGGNGLALTSNTTAAASNTQTLFSSILTGANATSTQKTFAGAFGNGHTGTASTNVSGYFFSTNGTTNIGIEAVATGGTNNYAIVVPVSSGYVGINTATPSSLLYVDGLENAEDVTFAALDVFSTTASQIILSTGSTTGVGTDITGKFALKSVSSPAQFTANVDNFNTEMNNTSVLRISTDASRDLTGMTNGYAGRIVHIFNVGAFNLVIKNDVTSTAANRFLLNADVTILPNEGYAFMYDAVSSRWRQVK